MYLEYSCDIHYFLWGQLMQICQMEIYILIILNTWMMLI